MNSTMLMACVAAYLLGSVPFAIVVSRVMRLQDPREFGSKNPGATNVLRGGNKLAAALTLLGDAGKGALAVILARELGLDVTTIAAVSLAVFAGHLWPIFAKFKGGKGVATALGILLALHVWLGLAALATWILVFAATRLSSLAAILAAFAAPIYAMFLLEEKTFLGVIFVLSLLLVQRHKKNILNLLAGTEGKIGQTAAAKDAEK